LTSIRRERHARIHLDPPVAVDNDTADYGMYRVEPLGVREPIEAVA